MIYIVEMPVGHGKKYEFTFFLSRKKPFKNLKKSGNPGISGKLASLNSILG